jgi:hypothetical protein
MKVDPPEKKLQKISFFTLVTRGLIRDQRMRRWTMFILVLVAMLMVFLGTTFLEEAINPRQHVGWFVLFWCACAWFTVTALLLALFDLLMVRAQNRAARKALREQLK